MQLAPGDIGRVIDLAVFLAQQGHYEESDALFARAAQIEPDSPKLMFARAAAYIQERAEPRRREDASPPVRRIADYARRSAPF